MKRLSRLNLSVVLILTLFCAFTLTACEDGADAFDAEDYIDLPKPDDSELIDQDGDGVWDEDDNCPATENAAQSDIDADGIGDLCDDDMDGDGVINVDDNCKRVANADQEDVDQDGKGNACDYEFSIISPILRPEFRIPIISIIADPSDPSDPSDPGQPQPQPKKIWKKLVGGDLVSMAVDDSGAPVAVGHQGTVLSTSQDVKVSIGSGTSWETLEIDVKDAVASFPYFSWDEALFDEFKDFPISAVAQVGGRTYVGTSGLLLYSDGGPFEVADIFPMISPHASYYGFHYSCANKAQHGSVSTAAGQLISVNRICDIDFDASGAAIVAYDNGIAFNDKLKEHIDNPTKHEYNWQGDLKSDHITHDVSIGSSSMIAGRDDGVFESTDGGKAWSQVALDGHEVFSVYIAPDGTRFAGTVDTVYSDRSGQWEAVGKFDDVLSISGNGSLVVIGTSEGVHTSSMGLTMWANLTHNLPSQDVRAVSCDGSKIYAATSQGLFELELN